MNALLVGKNGSPFFTESLRESVTNTTQAALYKVLVSGPGQGTPKLSYIVVHLS